MASRLDAASHTPINGAMKSIMHEFILAPDRHRSTLTRKDVPAVVNFMTALLEAMIHPTGDALREAAQPIAVDQIETARKHHRYQSCLSRTRT